VNGKNRGLALFLLVYAYNFNNSGKKDNAGSINRLKLLKNKDSAGFRLFKMFSRYAFYIAVFIGDNNITVAGFFFRNKLLPGFIKSKAKLIA